MPTSTDLDELERDLLASNKPLRLAQPLRWLLPDSRRASKDSSSVVAVILRSREKDLPPPSSLVALATSLRVSPLLRRSPPQLADDEEMVAEEIQMA